MPTLPPHIATALVTTLFGLLVAVPALGAFAMFRHRIDELVAESSLLAEHVFADYKRNLILRKKAALGQKKRPAEAKPLLQAVLRENPKHEYNYTAMAYAETLAALGETEDALKSWQYVVANNSYPRAKVQLAELYLAKNQPDLARAELNAVLIEDPHAPTFQRKRDRVWVSRAKSLMGKLPK